MLTIALACAACTACVPFPVTSYVADPSQAMAVYSACPGNRHVVLGAAFVTDGIRVEVSVDRHDGAQELELRLDVPPGATVRLLDDRARIEPREPADAVDAVFPWISLVEHPVRTNRSDVPAIQRLRQPIGDPLIGGWIAAGSFSSPRHFWIGASTPMVDADEVQVTLPRFTVNDRPASLPTLRFHREHTVGWALINC